MERRVVVTGLGAITPIGNNVKEFWDGIKEGRCGIDEITGFDTTDFKVKLAAEVKNFNPEDYLDRRNAKRLDKFSIYAMIAAREAMEDSKITKENTDMDRCGTVISSGIGGLWTIEKDNKTLIEKGPDRVSPMYIPSSIVNMAAGNVAIDLGLRGESFAIVTACASGTHSIGEAFRSIQCGDTDVMLAGGTEASICPVGVAGFTALTALSTSNDPERCSLPFDKDRSGFVMGEGAGVVVLEELEHARKRGADILAEVVGYGATSDAYHITSPAEDGSGAAKAMELAIQEAGIEKEDLKYINAHGTATHHNDLFETRAIKLLFGEHAYQMKVNSTKSMIGHLLGAAGAVEFITCVKEIQDGFIHATAGYTTPDEEMNLNYVSGDGVEENLEYALSNSLGFGGHNASILVKKYRD